MDSLTSRLAYHDDLLDGDDLPGTKSANRIFWVIGAFFVLLLLWASLTHVNRTVRASGRVVPSSKLQVVSHFEGGVIDEILVKPGQQVKKGDILVRLSPTMSSAALGRSSASVDALRARIARLSAEVKGSSPDYGTASASQVAIERSLHGVRQAEFQSLMAANSARVTQARRAVTEAEAVLTARNSNLDAAQRELEMLRPLAEKEIVSRVDLIKAENRVNVATSEVAAARSSVARARASVAEASAGAAQLRSDWLSRAGTELSQAQSELSQQEATLPALSDRVDRTTIRSPMNGKVNRVLVNTLGSSVAAGKPIIEVVPTDETLYVEALVRPSDVANVRVGQDATIEITAFNSAIFGRLQGKVRSIYPDATTNERTGESFYTVEVTSTSSLTYKDGKKVDISPGMMANVNLIGESRSILSYVLTPITRLSENAFRE
ncbi:HlyD family type I secretion periplasmic adaptor subunit [Novosphingobium mangrovi (ex Huang et al. 2023)]|uniref:Membrane fusion protein (MFP) family protein n=1 Tax=Novosphingobium mangrovi (ex Huang et al. 2023) TaxID=2976432 RepID=A0ABT2IB55_9SPHN|nr:HlyD family type I secretion periplasmic adaptor subunit [Novosphingobium mangrovi (ex Huang et al. 2023)]MCT2401727.1 HlyD family type I secretion periplasmic adaptor subunit [Novosphingobium mangrovi (ex Huang et al. 2023)]